MTTKTEPEEIKQQMEAQLHQLEDNKIFQEVRTQLTQQLQISRKEQRSALLKSDSQAVFRLEATISGIEKFFEIVESKLKMLDKLSEDKPTVFKY